MTSECITWLMTLTLLFFVYILTGCDTVQIEERVIYSDNTPVQKARVRQWTDEFKGGAITDENGEWSMRVPADTLIGLCIENPRNNNKESCYQGILITPSVDGGTEMTKD